MSLISSRLALIHRCVIERDLNAGTDDGWGNPLPPDWQVAVTDVPCRAWVSNHDTVTTKSTLAVVLEYKLIVSVGTDILETDRVTEITWREDVLFEGPLAVHAILRRPHQLEVILAKAI